VAGAEGIEPSAYGFGGLHGRTSIRLVTGHNRCRYFGIRCIKMFGTQFKISMHICYSLRSTTYSQIHIVFCYWFKIVRCSIFTIWYSYIIYNSERIKTNSILWYVWSLKLALCGQRIIIRVKRKIRTACFSW